VTFAPLLEQLRRHEDLTTDQAAEAMGAIMDGQAQSSQIAALLMALALKGERPDEIVGFARAMRARAVPLAGVPDGVFDTCGTGGDGAHTFNISTASMFVAAAAGARVAKHGGRSVSSSSGSADVIESLGAHIDLKPEQIAQSIAQTAIVYMFSPNHHAAMKNVAPVRRELGVRSIFNILGPLTNPAGAPNILMGVFHPDLVGIQVRVLQRLGAEHAVVVWGRDNMDEVSLGAGTMVGELVNGEIREYEIHPEDFGLAMISSRNLKVANAAESQARVLEALRGEPGPAHDIVALNAGTALYAAGVASSIEEGLQKARAAIASGAALAKLDQFVSVTRQLGAANQP
jgi:anthranilate phosphoribosyltransferase